MFVLIYSDNELLTCDNTVRVFATHDDAWSAMVEEFVDSIRRDGSEPVLPVDGGDVFDHDCKGLFLGYMDGREAYTDHCEEKWVIFEVPGAFVPKTACDGFRKSIREAADMYGDEDRADWFDADDLCQQVCWELEGYLGKE